MRKKTVPLKAHQFRPDQAEYFRWKMKLPLSADIVKTSRDDVEYLKGHGKTPEQVAAQLKEFALRLIRFKLATNPFTNIQTIVGAVLKESALGRRETAERLAASVNASFSQNVSDGLEISKGLAITLEDGIPKSVRLNECPFSNNEFGAGLGMPIPYRHYKQSDGSLICTDSHDRDLMVYESATFVLRSADLDGTLAFQALTLHLIHDHHFFGIEGTETRVSPDRIVDFCSIAEGN